MGGLVDQSYYLSNQCKLLANNNSADLDNMTVFVLPAKSKKHLEFNVDSCGQTLRCILHLKYSKFHQNT